jgi:hypothetical protein
LQDALPRDDTPLFPSLRDLLKDNDIHNRTLFTVVEDALVDRQRLRLGEHRHPFHGSSRQVLGLGRRP